MSPKLKVRQIKSAGGHEASQAATVRALGISHLNQTVEKGATTQLRGLIFKIRHLVEVEESR
jgi:large subunit ribosomal protein L30